MKAEKPLTIATYAAGASLAAVALVYVFGPTFFLDDDVAGSKKKGVVGLSNMANDCFINSILQALAGLPDLRRYLIREIHRRELDGAEVYRVDGARHDQEETNASRLKLEGLQKGLLTYGLKEILDHLNERPLYRKTISPQPFILALERAFGTRISRQQQDAQEFLQIVTERLCDEYHAGSKARKIARRPENCRVGDVSGSDHGKAVEHHDGASAENVAADTTIKDAASDEPVWEEDGFPFEGKIESQIECQTCHFKPKPTVSTFVTLTLNVPQVSTTSLNACFDGILKVEYIDDFKCEYCRLEHALQSKSHDLSTATDTNSKDQLESDITKIRHALEDDPEHPPKDVELPALNQSPKRRIARHMYISRFPKVLAVHLSRSMFAVGSDSMKNLAKVAFPECLPLGSLLHRKIYRLLCMVAHKGSHESGHYETFRRQVQPLPFSTPLSLGTGGAYSQQGSPHTSAAPSAAASPHISTSNNHQADELTSPMTSITPLVSPSIQCIASQESHPIVPRGHAPTSHAQQSEADALPSPWTLNDTDPIRTKSLRSFKDRAAETASSISGVTPLRRKIKKASSRWWRISDDKIKESKTSDVLSMNKEVYLLFYELDRMPQD